MFTCRNTFLTSKKMINKIIRRASVNKKIIAYLDSERHLKEMKQFIPTKYLVSQRYNSLDSLYLIDVYIARNIRRHMLPSLFEGDQIIAETGAGLGLVASELLDNKVKRVRLYESCPEFISSLRDFNKVYPDRVELFSRNLFHLGKISWFDKLDRGNRVSQMLKNVPRKAWNKGPSMTVFGCLINRNFINYLLRMMAMQAEIAAYGRVQMFVIMRPSDYIKLTSGSSNDLHTYQSSSVLFQMLFQHKLIDKYPRQAFLPWENKHSSKKQLRYSDTIDVDKLYLVKILPKRTLPVPPEQVMALYFFVKQLFGRGKNKILPTMEKWLPGSGKQLIVPSKKYRHYYKDLNIYTCFGELNPLEILSMFQEMVEYEGFKGSAFEAMIQSELVKYETRETDDSFLLEESLESLSIEELEEKFE